MKFNENMGATDRAIRLIVAVILAVLAVNDVVTGTLAIIFYVAAGIFVLTSLVKFCPLYLPFKLSTKK